MRASARRIFADLGVGLFLKIFPPALRSLPPPPSFLAPASCSGSPPPSKYLNAPLFRSWFFQLPWGYVRPCRGRCLFFNLLELASRLSTRSLVAPAFHPPVTITGPLLWSESFPKSPSESKSYFGWPILLISVWFSPNWLSPRVTVHLGRLFEWATRPSVLISAFLNPHLSSKIPQVYEVSHHPVLSPRDTAIYQTNF